MRIASTALVLLLAAGADSYSQSAVQSQPPASPPATQAPGSTTPAQGTPVVPPPTLPPPPMTRTFTTQTGMIFNAVRPDRVVDFETVIGYLEQALQKSTDATVRAQARGWHVYKATEPGPNGTVLYVFVMDPAVPGADYGLGKILSDAYPDRIEQIWKLYQGALAGGGSLLNLTPVQGPPPAAAPPATNKPAATPPPVPPPPGPGEPDKARPTGGQ